MRQQIRSGDGGSGARAIRLYNGVHAEGESPRFIRDIRPLVVTVPGGDYSTQIEPAIFFPSPPCSPSVYVSRMKTFRHTLILFLTRPSFEKILTGIFVVNAFDADVNSSSGRGTAAPAFLSMEASASLYMDGRQAVCSFKIG